MNKKQQKLFGLECPKCGLQLYYFETEFEIGDGCSACDEGTFLPVILEDGTDNIDNKGDFLPAVLEVEKEEEIESFDDIEVLLKDFK